MIPLAVLDLADEPELTGAPSRVYVKLLRELDFMEFRRVKAWAVAHMLKMRPQTVGKSLALLVEKGFLEAGDYEKGVGRAYRLNYSRATGRMAPERTHKAS